MSEYTASLLSQHQCWRADLPMISFIPAAYGVDTEDTVCTEMASGTSYEITEPADFFFKY